jgi:hypothetical protein
VSKDLDPRQAGFEEASSNLDEGLKSCRSVLRNYRAILANQEPPSEPAPAPTEVKESE